MREESDLQRSGESTGAKSQDFELVEPQPDSHSDIDKDTNQAQSRGEATESDKDTGLISEQEADAGQFQEAEVLEAQVGKFTAEGETGSLEVGPMSVVETDVVIVSTKSEDKSEDVAEVSEEVPKSESDSLEDWELVGEDKEGESPRDASPKGDETVRIATESVSEIHTGLEPTEPDAEKDSEPATPAAVASEALVSSGEHELTSGSDTVETTSVEITEHTEFVEIQEPEKVTIGASSVEERVADDEQETPGEREATSDGAIIPDDKGDIPGDDEDSAAGSSGSSSEFEEVDGFSDLSPDSEAESADKQDVSSESDADSVKAVKGPSQSEVEETQITRQTEHKEEFLHVGTPETLSVVVPTKVDSTETAEDEQKGEDIVETTGQQIKDDRETLTEKEDSQKEGGDLVPKAEDTEKKEVEGLEPQEQVKLLPKEESEEIKLEEQEKDSPKHEDEQMVREKEAEESAKAEDKGIVPEEQVKDSSKEEEEDVTPQEQVKDTPREKREEFVPEVPAEESPNEEEKEMVPGEDIQRKGDAESTEGDMTGTDTAREELSRPDAFSVEPGTVEYVDTTEVVEHTQHDEEYQLTIEKERTVELIKGGTVTDDAATVLEEPAREEVQHEEDSVRKPDVPTESDESSFEMVEPEDDVSQPIDGGGQKGSTSESEASFEDATTDDVKDDTVKEKEGLDEPEVSTVEPEREASEPGSEGQVTKQTEHTEEFLNLGRQETICVVVSSKKTTAAETVEEHKMPEEVEEPQEISAEEGDREKKESSDSEGSFEDATADEMKEDTVRTDAKSLEEPEVFTAEPEDEASEPGSEDQVTKQTEHTEEFVDLGSQETISVVIASKKTTSDEIVLEEHETPEKTEEEEPDEASANTGDSEKKESTSSDSEVSFEEATTGAVTDDQVTVSSDQTTRDEPDVFTVEPGTDEFVDTTGSVIHMEPEVVEHMTVGEEKRSDLGTGADTLTISTEAVRLKEREIQSTDEKVVLPTGPPEEARDKEEERDASAPTPADDVNKNYWREDWAEEPIPPTEKSEPEVDDLQSLTPEKHDAGFTDEFDEEEEDRDLSDRPRPEPEGQESSDSDADNRMDSLKETLAGERVLTDESFGGYQLEEWSTDVIPADRTQDGVLEPRQETSAGETVKPGKQTPDEAPSEETKPSAGETETEEPKRQRGGSTAAARAEEPTEEQTLEQRESDKEVSDKDADKPEPQKDAAEPEPLKDEAEPSKDEAEPEPSKDVAEPETSKDAAEREPSSEEGSEEYFAEDDEPRVTGERRDSDEPRGSERTYILQLSSDEVIDEDVEVQTDEHTSSSEEEYEEPEGTVDVVEKPEESDEQKPEEMPEGSSEKADDVQSDSKDVITRLEEKRASGEDSLRVSEAEVTVVSTRETDVTVTEIRHETSEQIETDELEQRVETSSEELLQTGEADVAQDVSKLVDDDAEKSASSSDGEAFEDAAPSEEPTDARQIPTAPATEEEPKLDDQPHEKDQAPATDEEVMLKETTEESVESSDEDKFQDVESGDAEEEPKAVLAADSDLIVAPDDRFAGVLPSVDNVQVFTTSPKPEKLVVHMERKESKMETEQKELTEKEEKKQTDVSSDEKESTEQEQSESKRSSEESEAKDAPTELSEGEDSNQIKATEDSHRPETLVEKPDISKTEPDPEEPDESRKLIFTEGLDEDVTVESTEDMSGRETEHLDVTYTADDRGETFTIVETCEGISKVFRSEEETRVMVAAEDTTDENREQSEEETPDADDMRRPSEEEDSALKSAEDTMKEDIKESDGESDKEDSFTDAPDEASELEPETKKPDVDTEEGKQVDLKTDPSVDNVQVFVPSPEPDKLVLHFDTDTKEAEDIRGEREPVDTKVEPESASLEGSADEEEDDQKTERDDRTAAERTEDTPAEEVTLLLPTEDEEAKIEEEKKPQSDRLDVTVQLQDSTVSEQEVVDSTEVTEHLTTEDETLAREEDTKPSGQLQTDIVVEKVRFGVRLRDLDSLEEDEAGSSVDPIDSSRPTVSVEQRTEDFVLAVTEKPSEDETVLETPEIDDVTTDVTLTKGDTDRGEFTVAVGTSAETVEKPELPGVTVSVSSTTEDVRLIGKTAEPDASKEEPSDEDSDQVPAKEAETEPAKHEASDTYAQEVRFLSDDTTIVVEGRREEFVEVTEEGDSKFAVAERDQVIEGQTEAAESEKSDDDQFHDAEREEPDKKKEQLSGDRMEDHERGEPEEPVASETKGEVEEPRDGQSQIVKEEEEPSAEVGDEEENPQEDDEDEVSLKEQEDRFVDVTKTAEEDTLHRTPDEQGDDQEGHKQTADTEEIVAISDDVPVGRYYIDAEPTSVHLSVSEGGRVDVEALKHDADFTVTDEGSQVIAVRVDSNVADVELKAAEAIAQDDDEKAVEESSEEEEAFVDTDPGAVTVTVGTAVEEITSVHEPGAVSLEDTLELRKSSDDEDFKEAEEHDEKEEGAVDREKDQQEASNIAKASEQKDAREELSPRTAQDDEVFDLESSESEFEGNELELKPPDVLKDDYDDTAYTLEDVEDELAESDTSEKDKPEAESDASDGTSVDKRPGEQPLETQQKTTEPRKHSSADEEWFEDTREISDDDKQERPSEDRGGESEPVEGNAKADDDTLEKDEDQFQDAAAEDVTEPRGAATDTGDVFVETLVGGDIRLSGLEEKSVDDEELIPKPEARELKDIPSDDDEGTSVDTAVRYREVTDADVTLTEDKTKPERYEGIVVTSDQDDKRLITKPGFVDVVTEDADISLRLIHRGGYRVEETPLNISLSISEEEGSSVDTARTAHVTDETGSLSVETWTTDVSLDPAQVVRMHVTSNVEDLEFHTAREDTKPTEDDLKDAHEHSESSDDDFKDAKPGHAETFVDAVSGGTFETADVREIADGSEQLKPETTDEADETSPQGMIDVSVTDLEDDVRVTVREETPTDDRVKLAVDTQTVSGADDSDRVELATPTSTDDMTAVGTKVVTAKDELGDVGVPGEPGAKGLLIQTEEGTDESATSEFDDDAPRKVADDATIDTAETGTDVVVGGTEVVVVTDTEIVTEPTSPEKDTDSDDASDEPGGAWTPPQEPPTLHVMRTTAEDMRSDIEEV